MTVDGEATRARLLAAARDHYLEVGLVHFSLREVARRSEVSAAAVYRHFAGKDALVREVCIEGFRTFGAYLMRALSAKTPRARLVRSSELYLQFGVENPADYRVIFMGAAEQFQSAGEGPTASPTFQFLVDRVRECMQEKVLARGDEREIAGVIWAHVHGLTSLRITGHMTSVGDDGAYAKFYAHAVNVLIAGLAP